MYNTTYHTKLIALMRKNCKTKKLKFMDKNELTVTHFCSYDLQYIIDVERL